jgi:DNA repair exonuclease SbcCD ATPase subunit
MAKKIAYNQEIELSNFSCFDEEGWSKLSPTPDKINIALYHGAVRGSKTDIDWEMEGEVDVDMFDGYDFVFLGDIHKYQYLDEENRVAYCGSTIQQNFGESTGKGFLLWEIDSKERYRSRHVEVPHDRPFVTVDWQGSVTETLDVAEEHPDRSRFRIRTSTAISQGEIKQLYASLKEFKSASEIVMKHEPKNSTGAFDDIGSTTSLNLRDPKFVSQMIQDYYQKAGLSDRMNARLDETLHSLWKSVINADPLPAGRWSIKSLDFDNIFGFGKDNKINFDAADGIVGIFGKNRIGKSSICGTVMYTLFNATDRGPISNLHVINTRKGHCKASALISKSGKNYLIERQTVKKQSRAGKLSAATQLNLLEVDDDLNIIRDMCGEQRRETEKTLRDIVGMSDDFLLTSFAAQGEMNTFLKQKASSRKAVLSKFLQLDVFEKLHDAAKEESTGVKQLLKNVPDRDFDVAIIDFKSKLVAREEERSLVWERLEKLRRKTRELELTLATRSDGNLVTQQDIDEQQEKIVTLHSEITRRELIETKLAEELTLMTEKSEKLALFKEAFPLTNLKSSLEEQNQLDNSVSSIKHCVDKEKQRLKSLQKQTDKLSDVPCGDSFPTCQYIVSAKKAKKLLKAQGGKIDELRDDLRATRKCLKKLTDQDLQGKLERYNDLLSKHNGLEIEKSQLELKQATESNDLKNTKEVLDLEDKNLDEMKANLSTNDAAAQVKQLREKLADFKNCIGKSETKHAALSETIGLLSSDIEKLRKDKEQFKALIEQWKVFELFLQATSKNGIPLEVIRSRLPEINKEIASVLQGVTGFTVELESDEGSNEMTIYINYGDSRRIIECASGMEKMMSALAIRVALINVSSLPKADILIIDEGFGALDGANVEACGRFLEALKKWFKTILVISHVDAVKDNVDNVLEIERRGVDSYVVFS